MHPGFLVLRSNLAAENPRSWDILTGKGCSSHRQGLLPFPLELPEFCPFMASALPAPQHSSPLCEVSVIFGCPLPSFLPESVSSSVSHLSSLGLDVAPDHSHLAPRGLVRGPVSEDPERAPCENYRGRRKDVKLTRIPLSVGLKYAAVAMRSRRRIIGPMVRTD